MNKNIPILVILSDILPFLYTARELTKWKVVDQFFNKNIISHSPLERICSNCKSKRFRVYYDKNNCRIQDCMALDIIHPGEDYTCMDGKLVCGMGCLMSYYGNKYTMSQYK